MTEDELDDLPLADEAKLEASSKAVRRGMASLRGTRRSNYLRRAVLKVLAMSKEERAAFDPPTGFYEMAKLVVEAPLRPDVVIGGYEMLARWIFSGCWIAGSDCER